MTGSWQHPSRPAFTPSLPPIGLILPLSRRRVKGAALSLAPLDFHNKRVAMGGGWGAGRRKSRVRLVARDGRFLKSESRSCVWHDPFWGTHSRKKPDCGKIRRRQNPTWQHLPNRQRPVAKSFCRGRLRRQRLNSCQLLVYKSLQSRTVFQTHGEKEREREKKKLE